MSWFKDNQKPHAPCDNKFENKIILIDSKHIFAND